MNRPLDHEECSALLRPYVQGSLPAAEADPVRAHLDTCATCRAEQRALQALLASSAPLTRAESDELRSAILGELRAPTPLSVEATRPRPPRQRAWKGTRLLAAAAVLVAGFVFVRSDPFGGLGGEDSPAESGMAASDQIADVSERLRFQRPDTTTLEAAMAPPQDAAVEGGPLDLPAAGDSGARKKQTGSSAGTGGTGGAGGGSDSADRARGVEKYQGPPRPLYVRDGGNLTDRKLTLVGRYGLPLVLFPKSYTTADAAELQEDFLVALADAADTEAQSQQIIDCGAQVLSQAGGVLPGLATFGAIDGEPTFALALAWTEAESGPLDRYMVWTWPAGSCDAVPGYRAGRIGV